MEDIKKRISKLVDLKSIISIIMVAAMVAGFFGKMVSAEQFVPLVTMIAVSYTHLHRATIPCCSRDRKWICTKQSTA